MRMRSCTAPAPAHGGAKCSGKDQQSANCNTNPCPVNGGWTKWEKWSKCTKTCGGGKKSRLRFCTAPKPAHGGDECVGDDVQVTNCKTKPCPVNGGWSKWNAWGSCSKSCGGGQQMRMRSCTEPAPAHGGIKCSGKDSENRSCNTKKCPDLNCKNKVNTQSCEYYKSFKYCTMESHKPYMRDNCPKTCGMC